HPDQHVLRDDREGRRQPGLRHDVRARRHAHVRPPGPERRHDRGGRAGPRDRRQPRPGVRPGGGHARGCGRTELGGRLRPLELLDVAADAEPDRVADLEADETPVGHRECHRARDLEAGILRGGDVLLLLLAADGPADQARCRPSAGRGAGLSPPTRPCHDRGEDLLTLLEVGRSALLDLRFRTGHERSLWIEAASPARSYDGRTGWATVPAVWCASSGTCSSSARARRPGISEAAASAISRAMAPMANASVNPDSSGKLVPGSRWPVTIAAAIC